MKKLLSIVLSISIVVSLFGCSAKELNTKNYGVDEKPFQFVFDAFDTKCSISIYGVKDDAKCRTWADDMSSLVHKFDDVFSKTKEGSDIYNINHRTSNTVKVHSDVATLMMLGKDFYSWTGGKFDISAGTLVDLWDIKNRKTLPSLEEINEARKHCGNFNYEISEASIPEEEKNMEIVFSGDEKTQYDLGALVKGFCCDRISAMLDSNEEISACILNLGGNVCVKGKLDNRPDGAFNVGIVNPAYRLKATGSNIIDSVKVVNKNVITSGNYERYFKVPGDDTIYHHIIDPKTGYPTNNNLNSVTIVSDNGLLGDFMSTSCMLLGYENSRDLIDNCSKSFDDKNIQGVFVFNDDSVIKYPLKVKLK